MFVFIYSLIYFFILIKKKKTKEPIAEALGNVQSCNYS